MEILVDYLKRCGGRVASHNVEMDAPRHGELFFLTIHNGGTYSRAFRELRESSELMQLHGLSFKEIETGGKEKSWQVIDISNMRSVDPTHETQFVL